MLFETLILSRKCTCFSIGGCTLLIRFGSSILKKDAAKTTVLGFTLEDPDSAGKMYTRAQKMQMDAEERAKKQKTWLVSEEVARQEVCLHVFAGVCIRTRDFVCVYARQMRACVLHLCVCACMSQCRLYRQAEVIVEDTSQPNFADC